MGEDTQERERGSQAWLGPRMTKQVAEGVKITAT